MKNSAPETLFNGISREEMIGQFFSPAAFINDNDKNIRSLERLIKDYHIGGLTFFHSRESAAANYGEKVKPFRNENSYERLKELIQHYQGLSKYPLLISIDAEWGLAMRLENTPQYPYALTLGALNDQYDQLIYQVGYNIGLDCKKAGIHLNLAPVVDINENSANPVIGYRSFGENKSAVTKKSIAFYKGMASAGIAGCLKHFPGHGNTSVDSHFGLPVIEKSEDELFSNEMVPFIEGIGAEVDCIMVGHLAVPALTSGKTVPATLSPDIIKGVLRGRLGFKGVVISDALNMKSISNIYEQKGWLELEAFKAGNDILCFSESIREAISLIDKNMGEEEIINSFGRIKELKSRVINTTPPQKEIEATELKEKIAIGTLTVVKRRFENQPLLSFPYIGRTAVVNLYKSSENAFSKTVLNYQPIPQYEISSISGQRLEMLTESFTQFDQLIIALYIPSVKPKDNYGIEPHMVSFLKKLIKSIRCVICLFGNPYVVAAIPELLESDSLVIAYQDLPEFEKKAAELLFGKFEATGKLPISLTNSSMTH